MDIDTLRAWPWVQFPWIAYALVTDQIGFIPGCAVSACVQLYSYAAAVAPHEKEEVTP